ncbi:hypothetical protein BS50DRAFT_490467 [Corynespora cassiicola Philippines]|uniref:LysM domain-containing protein n=1 Tax=Corynespora cassiicola Philippines TaxID=1448308 RepID=A0A2T2NTF8_CORCC|nr:hypothetical protein BS50DRAFT_490467 [Corynespora cassiicola Philippines]
MFSSLATSNSSTKAATCSDYALESIQVQLSPPFGFDEDFAQEFRETKSSCGSSGYSFTTPAALRNRAEDAKVQICSDPYVVKSGDSCDAIALARQVLTFSIIKAGGLKSNCSNLQPGGELPCLPSPCSLYRLGSSDNYKSIVSAHSGFTGQGLVSWNPNITSLCTNLADMTGNLICVGPPGDDRSDIAITVMLPTTTTVESIAVPKPNNGKEDTNAPCAS